MLTEQTPGRRSGGEGTCIFYYNTKSALAKVVVDSAGVENESRCTLNKMWILSKIYIDCFQVKVYF